MVIREFTCGRCGKTQSKGNPTGNTYNPRGWKRYNGVLTCEKCRRQNYHTITLSWRVKDCVARHNIPDNAVVAELQNDKGSGYTRKLDLKDAPPEAGSRLVDWVAKQLRVNRNNVRRARYGFDVIRFLDPMWEEVKQAADLAVVELLRQEDLPIRDRKFGLLDQNKVVAKLKEVFPNLPKHVVGVTVLRILGEYRKHRYDALVRGDHSTLTHKYGYPILICKGKWFPRQPENDGAGPRIEIVMGKEEGTTLAGKGSNQRLTLELCGGTGYKRFIASFNKLLAHEADGLELALKGVKRAGLPRSATELYAKLRLELPVETQEGAHGDLYVATDDKSFLIARVGERKLWRFNADHVPRHFRALAATVAKIPGWIEQHDERLQRLADDLKFEISNDAKASARIAVVRERFVNRQLNRLKTFIETVTTAVVNYAARRRFARIIYNDQRRYPYIGSHFPWSRLELRLRQKAEAHGLAFRKDTDEENLP